MHLGPWNVDLVRKGPWLRFVVTLLLGKKAVARICLRTSGVTLIPSRRQLGFPP